MGSSRLRRGGVSRHDLKLYTSDDILGIHEQYIERRSLGAKVVGAIMDDEAGRDLYLEYAKDGRSALWVRLPDKADVRRFSVCLPIGTTYMLATTAKTASRTSILPDDRDTPDARLRREREVPS